MLDWLQTILQERFGNKFILQSKSDGTWVLSLPEDTRYITLVACSEVFTRTNSDLPCAMWNPDAEGLKSALSLQLPAPGVANLKLPLVTPSAQGLHIGYDILGLAYWMLNRVEEIGRIELDRYQRFPATSSHAFKHGYLERPVVDEWLHILGQIIKRVWPNVELKQHRFSIKVSHDVDSPSMYAFKSWGAITRMMAGNLLKRHHLHAFLLAPYVKLASFSHIHSADPFNTFEWIMDQSDRNSLTSAFYFICSHPDPHDADYEPEDPRIRFLMRRIHDRGHEIGLHPSYDSYQRPDLICREAKRLWSICDEEGIEQGEWGGRMHYLRWNQPSTLQAWSNSGMNYDSTLSYADRPGFRCGTCFEFPAYNPVSQQSLPLRIRPLVMMECSVIDDGYLGLGIGPEALDKAMALMNACRRVEGCFTLLWHNSRLVTEDYRAFYQKLVAGIAYGA